MGSRSKNLGSGGLNNLQLNQFRSYRISGTRVWNSLHDSLDDFQDASFGIRGSSKDMKHEFNRATKSIGKKKPRKSTKLRSQASALIDEVYLEVEEAELQAEKSSGSLLEEEQLSPPKKIEQEKDNKNTKLFMGGPVRNKWPPSEPIYNDCDRRKNI